ncbi:YqzE family protein [Alteribacillus iranensis]|uniref:YqzE-like protein n=1 Tax=Alteribacillus iranensis TaxID=930128 RepID=A0A1I1ZEZ8_9BACI|nr:YqzE family protein [Alteribacillus iranensis]SFE30316.1 YqzE-like protein [Alteribacillus iranensis]
MKPHPFVKFITEEIVGAIDQKNDRSKKTKSTTTKEGFWSKWFGMVPYSVKMSWKQRRRMLKK